MTYEEFPVFVPMGEDRLCSVVCAPTVEFRDLGIVLLTGGNYTRTHRNGMWVRAARDLAERGFPSIRVDYHGIGESTGTAEINLEDPFDDDAIAAARFLQRSTGVTRVMMVATCFGGRSAMAAVARYPQAVAATIFPVELAMKGSQRTQPRRTLRNRIGRWLRRQAWGRKLLRQPAARRIRHTTAAKRERPDRLSPAFKRQLVRFLRNGGHVKFVYGEQTETLPDIRRCLSEVEPDLTAEQRTRVQLDVLPGTEVHRFQTLEDQDILVSRAVASVEEVYGRLLDRLYAR